MVRVKVVLCAAPWLQPLTQPLTQPLMQALRKELNALLPAEATRGAAAAHALSPAHAYAASWLRETDDTAKARLARHPITLHPVIRADYYLGWWKVLEARDEKYKLPPSSGAT